ncbi:MAG: AMP-binding protein [Thermodesulfobacteriota bacterium]
MPTDRLYWNMEMEPLLNTPEMERLQLIKLKKMLARLREGSPYYGRLIREAGLDPESLAGFDEYRDKIPPFDQKSRLALLEECEGDLLRVLGQLMPIRVDQLDYIATTTGTTGVPTPYPLTRADIRDLWGEVITRAYWRAGVRSHDRILFCFALSMVIAGVPTVMGMQKLGATLIPVGAEAKSERILMMQQMFRGTVFAGTPSLAEHLIGQAPVLIGKQVGELGFKAVFCGGEPGAGIPEVRARLEAAYGCRVYDAGAGFGCSCDHEEYQGMHWLADDLCYYELIDPETRAPLDLVDGAVGEAVFTTLEGEACVQLRQGFGDIHQVFTRPCPCGRSGFRYKVLGRRDDLLKVKGVPVYPSDLRSVIAEFEPRVTGRMRIVLTEPPPRVVPPLTLRLEYGPTTKKEDLPGLEKEIVEKMSRRLRVSPRLLWTGPGNLGLSHFKSEVFEREYEK